MRKYILFFCMGIALTLPSAAQNDLQEKFLKANQLYTEGNFEESAKEYRSIMLHGYTSPELNFNLGNAYFKMGKTGMARVYYEKALKMKPRDADIKCNLDFVTSGLSDSNQGRGAAEIILNWVLNTFSLNEITIVLTVLYLLFFVLLIITVSYNNFTLWWSRALSLFLLLAVSIWWYGIYYKHVKQKYAIITSKSVQVLSGPGENFTVGFTVPEGKKVLILKEHLEWIEIGLKKEGLKGWVRENEATKI